MLREEENTQRARGSPESTRKITAVQVVLYSPPSLSDLSCFFLRGLRAMAGANPAETDFKGSRSKKGRHTLGPQQRGGYAKKKCRSPRASRAQMSPRGAGKQPAIMERPQTTWRAAPACRRGQSCAGRTSRGPHRAVTRGAGTETRRGAGKGVSWARSGCQAATSAGGGAAAMF